MYSQDLRNILEDDDDGDDDDDAIRNIYTIDLTYTHDSMIKDKTCGLTSKNHGQSTCNYSLSLSTSVAALTGRRVANDQRPGFFFLKKLCWVFKEHIVRTSRKNKH